MKAWLSALVLMAASPAWAAVSPDTVLAAHRSAMGGQPEAGTVSAEYAYHGQGMSGSVRSVFDLLTGHFIDTQAIGLVRGTTGYDGQVPWMRDLSDAVTAQQGGDRIPLAVNQAYRNANRWWQPGHGGALITYAGRDTVDGAALHHLTVTPQGGKRFEAWFDAATHLLSRVEEVQAFMTIRTTYSDYRTQERTQERTQDRPQGRTRVPQRIVVDNGTGEANLQVLTLTRLGVTQPLPATAYTLPREAPTGAAIEGGHSVTLPFRLLNNHIYIEAQVNGKGPYNFMIDTGGHTILTPRVIADLGLSSHGEATAVGAGEKVASSGYAKVDDIRLGSLHLRDQVAITLDIYDPAIEGLRVDGMLGFELFLRFAVRIDYGAQTLTLTDPARFDAGDAGTAVPFTFYDHLPQVEGKLGDLPARFNIDTGSRSDVDVTAPFVAHAKLRTAYPRGVTAITGWGVGGPSKAYVVRVPSLTLGTVTATGVVASLSDARRGSFSDANYEGNIGSGLLKRYVVTFDYAHQRMYLKPISPRPADTGTFDRSGLWINAASNGFAVTWVTEHGPAADAGLKSGDLITAMDGQAVPGSTLPQVRRKLRELPPGTRIRLRIVREGQDREVDLILRDQL